MEWTKIVCIVLEILIAVMYFAIFSIIACEMRAQDKQITELKKLVEDLRKTDGKNPSTNADESSENQCKK